MFKAYSREKTNSKSNSPPHMPPIKKWQEPWWIRFLRIKLAILAAMSPNTAWAVCYVSDSHTKSLCIIQKSIPLLKKCYHRADRIKPCTK